MRGLHDVQQPRMPQIGRTHVAAEQPAHGADKFAKPEPSIVADIVSLAERKGYRFLTDILRCSN